MKYTTGKNIVCFGDTNIDIHIPYGEMRAAIAALGRGERRPTPKTFYTAGGTITNAALVFSRLGLPTYAATPIGGDNFSDFIVDTFRSYGIKTDFVFRQREPMTQILAVIDETGERTMLHFEGPGAKLPTITTEAAQSLEPHIPQMGWLYFCACSPGDTIGLVEKAHASGVRVALDLNLRVQRFGMDRERRKLLARMIGASDVVFGSGSDEFLPLTGIADVAEAAKSLLAPGRVVVARDGANSVHVFCGDEHYTAVPPDVEVVNKVGAGDSFSATFIAALELGCTLPEALRWANYVATWMISRTDRSDFPTVEEIRGAAACPQIH